MLWGRRAEREQLDRLLGSVRAGGSGALVVRGEAGVGKTALLGYAGERAHGCRVARAVGIRSEREYAFAGLHQLCAPMLDQLDRLPTPQRTALRTAFGLKVGDPPDRFVVGLAVLSLLTGAAGEHPLVCLVDDAQWLDAASAQALAFVARRVLFGSVGLVVAERDPAGEDQFAGLPQLVLGGLADDDARKLLGAALPGPLDERVRDRIVAETGGNPLALLELPRRLTPAELAGGFGLPAASAPCGRVEESFRRRVQALPADTQRLLLVAAAEPAGESTLVWQAAGRLGIGTGAGASAAAAGLVEPTGRLGFPHPLVRSAVYRAALPDERRLVHGALAVATDPATDPDRRAWHRAHAAAGPDEAVAAELDRCADRAQARGGLAAAAAFLDRAVTLTPEPAHRADRAVAAAAAKRDAGAFDDALRLVATVRAGPPDALRAARAGRLRGQIAHLRLRADAPGLLLDAARRLEPFDAGAARETYIEALGAASWDGGPAVVLAAARAALAAPPDPVPAGPVDLLLEGFARRYTQGYAAAAPTLRRALDLLRAPPTAAGPEHRWLWTAGSVPGRIAVELWDDDAARDLTTRQVRRARACGALVQQQFALGLLAHSHLLAGDLSTAQTLIEEDHAIAVATGNPPHPYAGLALAAWRGRAEPAAASIAAALHDAVGRGDGRLADAARYASAVLYNGLGRHQTALGFARRLFERDSLGYGALVLPELVEAAQRTGELALATAAMRWLSVRATATPTDWVCGIEARGRALLAGDATAEELFVESATRLDRTRVRVEVARTRLLYGEWLRRQRRRRDAREQLRTAHELFTAMGLEAFAERAGRELLATGEHARKRTVDTSGQLTPQEAQIAGLARDGLANPEIGARLFISPRTVQYHLHKVFAKLDINSRTELARASW